MAIIKKSLLFTAHIVDNKITCVRCNLTGKFVKHSIYFAIENKTNSDSGVTVDFSIASLLVFVTSIVRANYQANKQAYCDAKIAVVIMFLALPVIFVFGQTYKLITTLLGA